MHPRHPPSTDDIMRLSPFSSSCHLLFCHFLHSVVLTARLDSGRPAAGGQASASSDPLSQFVSIIEDRQNDLHLVPVPANGQPVTVGIGLYVTNVGEVSEIHMDYSVTVYFRQQWYDPRLQFDIAGVEYVTLSEAYSHRLWRPDTYFQNGKDELRHVVPLPNEQFRIFRDGRIFLSQRLSLKLWCSLVLTDFPMDSQTCRIYMMSYRYKTSEMTLHWLRGNAVVFAALNHPLFNINVTQVGQRNRNFSTGEYSGVYVELNLARQLGYYVAQIYVPSILIIALSWVSFWLEPEAVPGRISLGLLTVLTMTNHMNTATASLPKVSYLKSIDIWLTSCLAFLFLALLEFALVNSLARTRMVTEQLPATLEETVDPSTSGSATPEVNQESAGAPERMCITKQGSVCGPRAISPLLVDQIARVAFPVAFLLFNLVYWTVSKHG